MMEEKSFPLSNRQNKISLLGLVTIGIIINIASLFQTNIGLGEQTFPDLSGKPFGLVFQNPKEYQTAAQRFWFSWNTYTRIENLAKENPRGVYVRYYNLTITSPSLSKKYVPDYDYITTKYPEWLIRNKEGAPAKWYYDESFFFFRLGESTIC